MSLISSKTPQPRQPGKQMSWKPLKPGRTADRRGTVSPSGVFRGNNVLPMGSRQASAHTRLIWGS